MKEFYIEEVNNLKIVGRNGEDAIKLGDYLGWAKVLKIEAYGREFDELPPGMTAAITFNRMPLSAIKETNDKEFIEWLENKDNDMNDKYI